MRELDWADELASIESAPEQLTLSDMATGVVYEQWWDKCDGYTAARECRIIAGRPFGRHELETIWQDGVSCHVGASAGESTPDNTTVEPVWGPHWRTRGTYLEAAKTWKADDRRRSAQRSAYKEDAMSRRLARSGFTIIDSTCDMPTDGVRAIYDHDEAGFVDEYLGYTSDDEPLMASNENTVSTTQPAVRCMRLWFWRQDATSVTVGKLVSAVRDVLHDVESQQDIWLAQEAKAKELYNVDVSAMSFDEYEAHARAVDDTPMPLAKAWPGPGAVRAGLLERGWHMGVDNAIGENASGYSDSSLWTVKVARARAQGESVQHESAYEDDPTVRATYRRGKGGGGSMSLGRMSGW